MAELSPKTPKVEVETIDDLAKKIDEKKVNKAIVDR